MPLPVAVTPHFVPEPLDASDLGKMLAELPALYAALDMTTFPKASLQLINRLIPRAAFSSYNEIDLRTAAARIFFEPEHHAEQAERVKPGLWQYRQQHPIMRRYESGLHDGVWKISDFLGVEELHGLELYTEILAKLTVEDTLSFTLQSSNDLKVFYAINGPSRFTERDRTVAALLQPHLVQSFENALAFTDSRALALLSTHAISSSGEHGLILADPRGRILHANELAGSHLAEAFAYGSEETQRPTALLGGESLPRPLLQWLTRYQVTIDRPSGPFEISREKQTFTFRCARANEGHWIIATRCVNEASLCGSLGATFQLTPQQATTLLWLSRGKTNGEIASILAISERTVAKHLQNLFARLGVENRHGAAMKVIDALGSHYAGALAAMASWLAPAVSSLA